MPPWTPRFTGHSPLSRRSSYCIGFQLQSIQLKKNAYVNIARRLHYRQAYPVCWYQERSNIPHPERVYHRLRLRFHQCTLLRIRLRRRCRMSMPARCRAQKKNRGLGYIVDFKSLKMSGKAAQRVGDASIRIHNAAPHRRRRRAERVAPATSATAAIANACTTHGKLVFPRRRPGAKMQRRLYAPLCIYKSLRRPSNVQEAENRERSLSDFSFETLTRHPEIKSRPPDLSLPSGRP